MPKSPHWYTLRSTWTSNREFNDVVMMIRHFGYDTRFWSKTYRYWDCNGFNYWTMGAPIPETTLINRAVKKYATPYDSIADSYDSLHTDAESVRESAEVVEMAGDVSGSVLDIGCGTGLLFEHAKDIGSAGRYVGIDVSHRMLDRFSRKFPDRKGTLLKCSFEDYWGYGFSKIVALFGAANYIPHEHLARIPEMLAPGGEAFLMFYKPDYYPVTYSRTNTERPAHSAYVHKDGDEEYRHFIIRRIRAA